MRRQRYQKLQSFHSAHNDWMPKGVMKHMGHGMTSNWHARLGLSCDIVNHHVHLDRRLCLTGHYLARRRRGSFFAQLALALVLLTRLILALVRSSSAQPDLVLPEV